MIRVAFVADNQVDERSRLVEHDRVMEFVAEDARERGCIATLHGGDVYERRSTARERESVRAFLDTSSWTPFVLAGGNHEAPGEVVELHDPDRLRFAYERPEVIIVGDAPDCIAVAVLPWPRKTWLLEALGAPVAPEESDRVARECLRDILRGFREQLHAFPGPRILLAHAERAGAKTDPDQPECPGLSLALTDEDFAMAGADVVLLGHIHLPQEWHPIGGTPVIYAGSPRRTAYASGELVEKGYVVLEFGERGPDGVLPVTWERVPTPATAMHLVDWAWDVESAAFVPTDPDTTHPAQLEAGCEVRLRYRFPADRRDTATAEAQRFRDDWISRGAGEVKLEAIPIPVVTARAPAVATAETLRERLMALWEARDDVPPEERRERLFAYAEQLDAEVRS